MTHNSGDPWPVHQPTYTAPLPEPVLIPSIFNPGLDDEKWDRRHEEDLRMRCIEAAVPRVNALDGVGAIEMAQLFYEWVKKGGNGPTP